MSGKLGFFSCKHKKFFLWVENWFFEVDVKNFFVWTFFLYDGVKYMTFFGQKFLFGKGQVNVPSDRFFQTGMKNIFLWKISFLGKHINFCFFFWWAVWVYQENLFPTTEKLQKNQNVNFIEKISYVCLL